MIIDFNTTLIQIFELRVVVLATILHLMLNPVTVWFLALEFKFQKSGFKHALMAGLPVAILFIATIFLVPIGAAALVMLVAYLLAVALIRHVYSAPWNMSLLLGILWGVIMVMITIFVSAIMTLLG